jgi:hypothetical protein
LPPELREKIIKLVVVPGTGKRYMREPRGNNPGLSLMLSCRQIYEESKKLFWNNNFFVDHMDLRVVRKKGPDNHFFNNVKKLNYEWKDNGRDACAFRFINKFPKLEELELDFLWLNFEMRDKYGLLNENRTCRDEESFGSFRAILGLDALLEIRGLKHVNIKIRGTIPVCEQQTLNYVQYNFVAHLMETLTLPKSLPEPVSCPFQVQLADTNSYIQMLNAGWLQEKVGKGKGKSRKSDEAPDGEEITISVDELEEEIYIPQKTRTRSAKVVQKFGFEAVNDGDE